jgi:hypothetical protein
MQAAKKKKKKNPGPLLPVASALRCLADSESPPKRQKQKIDIDSASSPGPLLIRSRAQGEVHPVVFGAYGEVSEGTGVFIGKLAEAWAP